MPQTNGCIDSLFLDLRNELVSLLQRGNYEIDTASIADRESMPAGQASYALSLYYSARDRRLPPRRREVKVSSVFRQKMSSATLGISERSAIQNIIKLCENGGNMLPYQNVSTMRLETRFQNQDRLFNDWNLMHLHLGIGKPAGVPGFVDRSDDLIMVYPTSNCLYFVDLRQHGSETWLDKELLEIINTEWSYVFDRHKYPNARNASIQATPDIVKALRGKTAKQEKYAVRNNIPYTMGMIYPIELSDSTIIGPPGGGLASNGMRTNVGLRADDCMRSIAHWVEANLDNVRKNNGIHNPCLSLGLRIRDFWDVHMEIFERESAILLHEKLL